MTPLALIVSTLLLSMAGPWTAVGDGVSASPPVRLLAGPDSDILPGTIRPVHEVTLSSPFDTLLARLMVREGQTVIAGDVVAVLDDRVVQAAVRLAEQEALRSAQIDRAEAAVVHTADMLRRIRVVRDLNAAAESELVAAEAEHKKALADLLYAREARAEARASLQLARARLEEHSVRAPFDAVVVRVHAEPGSMLASGKPIVELMSVDGLCVDLYLPASLAANLDVGDRYALAVQQPAPAVIAGAVRYVEPRIDPVSRTMRVVFDLDLPADAPRLYAGALARPADEAPPPGVSSPRPMAAQIPGRVTGSD
tara:strand:+ start:7166 stop:8098 length:933 start_codon:yes stop_codon:yes gene_type:complete